MMSYEVENVMNRTMTVGQLREMLENYDENTPVFMTANYGDICRTIQALVIEDVVEASEGQLSESGYSHSGVAWNGEDANDCEAYCEQCDDMFDGMEKCPCCGTRMVAEDGEPWTASEGQPILILK